MIPQIVLALSLGIGGLSLLGFGLVLAAGPFEIVPLGMDPGSALAWDAGLCLVFFVQHSGMIRRSFRERLARLVPVHYQPAAYSIASGAALVLMMGLWQRTDVVLLAVEGPARWALRGLFVVAGLVFVWAIRALGSFDTFGLGPIRAHRRGVEPRSLSLALRGPYRWVRHPLYSIFLVLLWASPDVTADRLLFNILFTAWLVLGTVLEERDLVRDFGDAYRDYQRRVPMLVPWRVL